MLSRLFCLFFAFYLGFFQIAFAETGTSLNLDLSNTNADIQASSALGSGQSAVIQVGGQTKTVNAGDMITAGEFLAIQQILNGGQQNIQLSDMGSAIGGSFNLTNNLGSSLANLNSLVVPTNVTAIADFGLASTLNLAGNLTNAGNFYAISSNSQVTSAMISANNIFNGQNSLLTSILPQGGLAGYSNLVSNLSLSLNAINNIVNAGAITSAGNLSLMAGGTITNASNISGMNAVMSAMGNLNLQASNIMNQGTMISQLANINAMTGSLNNSLGSMLALNGNLNVQNLLGNSLAVNNVLGSMQANNILFETMASTYDTNGNLLVKSNIDLNGGDLIAQNIDFRSPGGIVSAKANSFNGIVGVESCDLKLRAETGNLTAGIINLSGDPIIEVPGGDLTITDWIAFNGADIYDSGATDVMFLAGGSVLPGTANPGSIIRATNAGGSGGRIYIAAGATWDASYNITGSSGLGGDINLGNVSLETNLTGTTAIRLDAYSGGGGTGNISIGNLTASGLGNQSGGTIAVNAQGTVSIGNVISQSGATGTGGAFTLTRTGGNGTFTIQSISAGSADIDNQIDSVTGSITITGATNTTPLLAGAGGMARLRAGTTIDTGSITTSANTSGNGGDIILAASGTITTGILTANKGGVADQAGAVNFNTSTGTNLTIGSQIDGGVVTLTSTDSIIINAPITADSLSLNAGSGLTVAAGIIVTSNNGLTATMQNLTNNGTIRAATTLTLTMVGGAATLDGAGATLGLTGNNGTISITGQSTPLTFNSVYTFNAAGTGNTISISTDGGANINLGTANIYNTGNNGIITISSSGTLNNNVGQVFNTGTNSTVTLSGDNTNNVNATNTFNIGATSSARLVGGAVNIAAATTQNSPGNLVVGNNNSNVTIGNGATISGNTLNLNGNSVTDNGTIQAVTTLNIDLYGAALMNGTPNPISITGANSTMRITGHSTSLDLAVPFTFNGNSDNSRITFATDGGANLTLDVSHTFNLGLAGVAFLTASGSVTANAAQNFNIGNNGYAAFEAVGTLNVNTANNTTLGSGAIYYFVGSTINFAPGLTITSTANMELGNSTSTINIPLGTTLSASNNIAVFGSVMNINGTLSAGNSLRFDLYGAGSLQGTPTDIAVTNANATLVLFGHSIPVTTANNYTFSALGNNSQIAFNSDGGASYNFNSSNTFNLGNNGTLNINPGGNAIFTASQTVNSGTTANVIFQSGPNGTVTVGAANNFTLGAGSTITFGAGNSSNTNLNATQTIAGAPTVNIYGGNVSFGAGSIINATGASPITISTNGIASGLTITAPTGATATLATNGGTINITPTAAQTLNFTAAGANSGIAFNGGAVTITSSAAIDINANASLSSDNNITINSNGINFTNNGAISSSNNNGNITVQSLSALNFLGSGTITMTGPGTPTILVVANAGALGFNANHTLNAGANGTVTLQVVDPLQSLDLANNVSLALGASQGVITSNTLTLNEGSSINTTRATGTGITIGGSSIVGGAPLLLRVAGANNTTGTISTGGANILITALAGQDLTLSSRFANPINISFQGGDTIITGSAALVSTGNGARLVSNRNIVINANGTAAMSIGDSITAANNITLNSPNNISLTAGTITAGQLLAGAGLTDDLLEAGDVLSNGAVLIDNYQLGTGTGDIIISAGVRIIGTGGATNPTVQLGSVGLHSNVDITVGANSELTSFGGYVWLNAGDDVDIGNGTVIKSIGKLDDNGNKVTVNNESITQYYGGAIGIYAGLPGADLPNLLTAALASRTGSNTTTVTAGSTFATDNTLTLSGGSLVNIALADPTKNLMSANNFTLNGSVLLIDPPDPGNTITFTGLAFTTVGVNLTPAVSPVVAAALAAGGSGIGFAAITITIEDNPLTVQVPLPTDVTNDKNVGTQYNLNSATKLCSPMAIAGSNNDSKEGLNWTVASAYCQPFYMEGSNGSLILGTGGTIFAPTRHNTVVIKEGKLVMMASKEGLKVETVRGDINIPANGTVLVEQNQQGVVRVANLDGTPATLTCKTNNENVEMQAKSGEEVLLGDDESAEEELIPVDGVEREPIEGGIISFSGLKAQRYRYDTQEMARKEMLLNCQMGCFSVTIRKRIDGVRAALEHSPTISQFKEIPAGSKGASPATSNTYTPIAYMPKGPAFKQPAVSGNSSELQTINTGAALVKHIGQATVTMDMPNLLELKSGEILISILKHTTVHAGEFAISLNPGTIALISHKENVVKVRNLWEAGPHSIKALANNKYLSIAAGQELLLSSDDQVLNKTFRADNIGRRRTHRFELTDVHKAVRSDVAFVTLAHNSSLLANLLRSPLASDKEVRDRIVKMAACVSQLLGKYGQYSQMAPNK
jgi:hypothetical protein